MNIPQNTVHYYTNEQLLDFALVLLDKARREQTAERMPINDNWLRLSHLKLFAQRWQLIRLRPPAKSRATPLMKLWPKVGDRVNPLKLV